MIRVTPKKNWQAVGQATTCPSNSLTTLDYGSITQVIKFTRPSSKVQSEVKHTGGSEQ